MSIGCKLSPGALRQRSGHLVTDQRGDATVERATGAETIAYLSDMIEQLRTLAERGGLPTLARLLDRAHMEATVQRAEE